MSTIAAAAGASVQPVDDPVEEYIRKGLLSARNAGDREAETSWLHSLREHLRDVTPHPQFCVTPERCRGMTSCPRSYACSE